MASLYRVVRNNVIRYYYSLMGRGAMREDVAGDLVLLSFIREILERHELTEEQRSLLLMAFEEIISRDGHLHE